MASEPLLDGMKVGGIGRASPQRAGQPGGGRGLPRLAGLDGIRGLAALAVVLYHAGVSWLPAGFLGVDVFFVVSGFLITALLIAERERDDRTDLIEFWLRRARRLLPVLALVLLATTLYAAIALQDTLIDHLREVGAAAVYITNWDQILRGVSYFEMFERPSQLRHLWSLAVEEQFYIVWPVVFALGARLLRLRWLWCGAVAAAALSIVWMAILFTPGDEPSRVYFGSDARAFTILIGAAAAFVWKPWRRAWAGPRGRLMDALALAALIGIGAIMAVGRHWSDWMYPWGLLAVSAATMTLVAFVIRPGSLIGSALEIAPLRWLGERSYSIYLWHWPIMLALQWEFGFAPNSLAIVGVGVIATFACSELSYRLVERPMRRPDFWSLERIRGRLADARPFAVAAASIAAAVLLALVIGFTVLPGRSPSELLFSASAGQSDLAEPPPRAPHTAAISTPDTRPQAPPAQAEEVNSASMSRPTLRSASPDSRSAQTETAASRPPQRNGPAQPAEDEPDTASAEDPANDNQSAPTSSSEPPGSYAMIYTVRAGDSLNRLSRQFDVTIDELAALNGPGITRMIHPGDALSIPCPGAAPCVFLRLDQIGEGCVELHSTSANEPARVCDSRTMLVSLPLRLSAAPGGPLDSLPKWTWNGSASEAWDFTLPPDAVERAEAVGGAPMVVEVRHGLPPLAIGDSVMAGAAERLGAVGIEVNAEVGRLALEALAVLADDAARRGPREVVIFQAVGTGFLDADGFQTLLDAAQGVRHLIVLTRQFPPREPLLSYERETNRMLREQSPLYDWVTLVDWNAISNGREDELTWDGTHLKPLGRQLYTDHILSAIMSRPPPQFRSAAEPTPQAGG